MAAWRGDTEDTNDLGSASGSGSASGLGRGSELLSSRHSASASDSLSAFDLEVLCLLCFFLSNSDLRADFSF
jgi:hypothetical protein